MRHEYTDRDESGRCLHSQRVCSWVTREDDETGEKYSEWVWSDESLVDDIDLHRMKCRECGEILYYSGLARRHFEHGEHSELIAESNARYIKRRKQ